MSATQSLTSNPKRGYRFYHAHWLNPEYGYDMRVPGLFEVTKVTRDLVYFRPVYGLGLDNERLGNGFYTRREQFKADVLLPVQRD